MADTRAADNYAHVDVVSGAVISSSHENSEGGKLETSINQANSMLLDIEKNYSSATEPDSTVNGKLWHRSDTEALLLFTGGTTAAIPFDGCTQAITLKGILTKPEIIPVRDVGRNLKMLSDTTATGSAVILTADELMLGDTAGTVRSKTSSLNITLDITATGPAGKDVADTIAASTWYYAYAISDGDTDSAVLSLDATHPAMPTDYVYYSKAGWVQTDTAGVITERRGVNNGFPTMYFKDVKASGTNGGTFTAAALRTRDLNTTEGSIPGASLSSNQITLPDGTYTIEAVAPAYLVDIHQACLYNITDGAIEITGNVAYAVSGTGGANNSTIVGQFAITGEKVFEIQHQCTTTNNNTGFGVNNAALTVAVSSVFTQVKITKIQ